MRQLYDFLPGVSTSRRLLMILCQRFVLFAGSSEAVSQTVIKPRTPERSTP